MGRRHTGSGSGGAGIVSGTSGGTGGIWIAKAAAIGACTGPTGGGIGVRMAGSLHGGCGGASGGRGGRGGGGGGNAAPARPEEAPPEATAVDPVLAPNCIRLQNQAQRRLCFGVHLGPRMTAFGKPNQRP